MLGFTLSKLNLLLLAIAASATVAYFMVIYIDASEAQAAQQLAQKLAQDAASLMNSSTYCDYLEFSLPRSFSVGGKEFYYKLRISGLEAQSETDNPKNYLIFSVIRKREGRESIVATSSVIASAEINVFRFGDETTLEPELAGLEEGAILDPQAIPRQNIVMLVKEIIDGAPYIYAIPCSSESDASSCPANKSSAAVLLERPEGFNC
ncbi:MAG: hypothetical protein J4415_00445 [Candidatus Diapherotrites archaeon]|uniref:Uncharacterized protein n=1 Tax=Candidatus Iainarchaeum sp. TaxID=3101447 RepID=A0A8T4KPQ6_9ARCH|nr:hypothetical protein [Candidatus Diapherotrites archaeon]